MRAAFLLANDLAVILLRQPITNAVGFDPLDSEGLARWAAEATTIYRDGIGVSETATDESLSRSNDKDT